MGELAEASVRNTLEAWLAGVQRIPEEEPEIDRLQIEIDQRVVALVALHQPVAADLRLLIAISRIAAELERIGDQAVNLSGSAARLAPEQTPPRAQELAALGQRACQMVHRSLHAFLSHQPELCQQVLREDDEVDRLRDALFAHLRNELTAHPEKASTIFEALLTTKNLERVADHATNIAEDVLFWTTGEDVRHRPPHRQ